MIRFESYKPEHLALIELQPAQCGWLENELRSAGYAAAMIGDGRTLSAFAPVDRLEGAQHSASPAFDGEIFLGCAGFIPQPPANRCIAWSLLSRRIRPRHFVAISRRVKAGVLAAAEIYDRIDIYVDPTHVQGICWAQILGFRFEWRLANWWPGGRDAALFTHPAALQPKTAGLAHLESATVTVIAEGIAA